MKAAIIGTGLAGLTCAKELIKKNIEVEIFEKKEKNESTRPRQMEGAVHFLGNIPDIKPTKKMKRAIFQSKKEKIYLDGNLGYLYEIGGNDGIESIFRKKIEKKININYGQEIKNINKLKKEYDYIIAADGYPSQIAKKLKMRDSYAINRGFGIGFTVKGDFDPNYSWTLFNDYYAPKGYTYIIPFDKSTASFVSASVTPTLNVNSIKVKLEKFIKKNNYEIIENWYDFETWYNFNTYFKDNVYIIGGAASLTEPTFGFGMKWAIKSAKLCVEAITTNQDYNMLLKYKLFPEFELWKLIRKIIDKSVRDDYNSFVKSFGNPLAKYYIEAGKYAPFIFKFAGWINNVPPSEEKKASELNKLQKIMISHSIRFGL